MRSSRPPAQRLDQSRTYNRTVAEIEATGFLRGESTVEAFELEGIFVEGTVARSAKVLCALRRLRPFGRGAPVYAVGTFLNRERMSVMTQPTATPASAALTADRVRIDFLFLDLTTCDRCRGTDRNLASALEAVREVLEATGATVELRKTLVETTAQARELRFVSSPTIRVNERDLAFELKESPCGCDACTDGSGEPIACRDWTYRGEEYKEAPVGLIVDAILGEVYGGARRRATAPDDAYALPENLERFFAAEGPACGCAAEPESCCEPAANADCCGTSTARGCDC